MSEALGFKFVDQNSQVADAQAQLLHGFSASPRSISPKFFYDERGSELFTEITRTVEYYPTRTEMSLLKQYGSEISRSIGSDSTLIEYGSGSSEKIRLLLETLKPRRYVPMDISRDYLVSSAKTIASDYAWLEVLATCVDYSQEFDLPEQFEGNVAAFFPGSSIGNFAPDAALEFLKQVRRHVSTGGLLIGVDLKKDHGVLNRAYNDSQGVTAEFNLNVLTHLNREHGANFVIENFHHEAFYNETLGCIQMFVVSDCDQVVTLAGDSFALKAGEEIHTENSFKYSEQEFRALSREAGFTQDRFWTDTEGWFGIFYLT